MPASGPRSAPSAATPASAHSTAGASRASSAEAAPKPSIRILLVDDHPVVRQGLRSCLTPFSHVSVVGEAADGEEALAKARTLKPDLVLMDIDMPGMSGLTATEVLHKENPDVKVLILSMHNDPDFVMRIIQSGARGYILKQAPTAELVRAIESINAGQTVFSPDVAHLALSRFVLGAHEGSSPGQLSNREREVLVAIAEGLSNKEIASRLNVGVRTVETHRERIMRKLNIHSVAGLTKYAVAKGLVPLPKGPDHKL